MPAQSDSALGRFDRLRFETIETQRCHTVSTFLAKFQTTAASLGPDERVKLEVVCTHKDMELVKAVLADPQASKICALRWKYQGKEDVSFVIPLLTNSCPELASVLVEFKHYSAFDFVSSVLEHPNNEMKELSLWYDDDAASIKTHLVPALRQSNCNLAELSLWAYEPEQEEVTKAVEDMFRNRLALFALLQGQQVRRLYCPLRRLPVEMLRLVGKLLL
ncbi:hypothetical protein BASA81_001596 [Batrachochytrium salamandrivorans]|nr:hypothetical protein BASA81_001596 [Batrachochytrium salamandrivorans]